MDETIAVVILVSITFLNGLLLGRMWECRVRHVEALEGYAADIRLRHLGELAKLEASKVASDPAKIGHTHKESKEGQV